MDEWIFTYHVKFYEECECEEIERDGFVVAAGMREAYNKIAGYYGEISLIDITIESIDCDYSTCFEMSKSNIERLKGLLE